MKCEICYKDGTDIVYNNVCICKGGRHLKCMKNVAKNSENVYFICNRCGFSYTGEFKLEMLKIAFDYYQSINTKPSRIIRMRILDIMITDGEKIPSNMYSIQSRVSKEEDELEWVLGRVIEFSMAKQRGVAKYEDFEVYLPTIEKLCYQGDIPWAVFYQWSINAAEIANTNLAVQIITDLFLRRNCLDNQDRELYEIAMYYSIILFKRGFCDMARLLRMKTFREIVHTFGVEHPFTKLWDE